MARPKPLPELIGAAIDVIEDERVAASSGVAAIVAQGSEAGGHRSTGAKPAPGEMVRVGTAASSG